MISGGFEPRVKAQENLGFCESVLQNAGCFKEAFIPSRY